MDRLLLLQACGEDSGGCIVEMEPGDITLREADDPALFYERAASFGENMRIDPLTIGASVGNFLLKGTAKRDSVLLEDVNKSAAGYFLAFCTCCHGLAGLLQFI